MHNFIFLPLTHSLKVLCVSSECTSYERLHFATPCPAKLEVNEHVALFQQGFSHKTFTFEVKCQRTAICTGMLDIKKAFWIADSSKCWGTKN